MASGLNSAPPPRLRLSFGQIARIAGWAPTPFIGFEGGFYASRRFPIFPARNQQQAADLCKGLNYRFADHPRSLRFGWLAASAFPRHERLNIEASIREAQRGELHGEAAEAIHSVARQAMTFAESLPKSRAGKPCYVFFRSLPGLREPCPLDRFVVLPNGEVEAAMEAEGQRWASKNRKLIVEHYRKRSARRTGGAPRREPSISLDDVIRESDEAFSEAMMMFAQDDEGGAKPKPVASPPAASKGVAPRRRWCLREYEARGTDTYHKPAKIHAKWDGMTATERAAICPDSPNKIDRSTVVSDIKRARELRDGKKPAKPKRKPRKKP